MGFVKFTEVGKNFTPRVIMTPAGVIAFNQGACKKFNLDLYSHLIMYMDADEHTIGFELVNDENLDGANKIRHIRRDGADINAAAFLKHFKLKLKRHLSFGIEEDDKTGWLVLHLDEGEVIGAVSAPATPSQTQVQTSTPPRETRDEKLSQSPTSTTSQATSKTPAVTALKTLASAVPANVSAARPTTTPVPEVQQQAVATRTRGVKAMLSELLQD